MYFIVPLYYTVLSEGGEKTLLLNIVQNGKVFFAKLVLRAWNTKRKVKPKRSSFIKNVNSQRLGNSRYLKTASKIVENKAMETMIYLQ